MIDTALKSCKRALVVAPHPDDEVLGVGATIARLADAGCEVHVAILTTGKPPRFSADQVETVKVEAKAAHGHLGVSKTHWLDFAAAELDTVGHAAVNAALGVLVHNIDPQVLFVPHPGDIHLDHQLAFLSSLVVSRPYQTQYPGLILAYETLSETNWNAPYLTPSFTPNIFIDVSDTIERKLEAFAHFKSQVKAVPHERSPEALRALATLRGGTIHRTAAEAFVLVRGVI